MVNPGDWIRRALGSAGERGRARADQWVAIDFETANETRTSACALGVAVVQGRRIVSHGHALIRPAELRFDPMNVSIHGIRAEDVADAPEFPELWTDMAPLLDGRTLVAHNAAFDLDVLRQTLEAYALPVPELRFHCTLQLARRVWPQLADHRLAAVARHVSFDYAPHDAEQDAMACAYVSLACCRTRRERHLDALGDALGVEVGRLHAGGFELPSPRAPWTVGALA